MRTPKAAMSVEEQEENLRRTRKKRKLRFWGGVLLVVLGWQGSRGFPCFVRSTPITKPSKSSLSMDRSGPNSRKGFHIGFGLSCRGYSEILPADGWIHFLWVRVGGRTRDTHRLCQKNGRLSADRRELWALPYGHMAQTPARVRRFSSVRLLIRSIFNRIRHFSFKLQAIPASRPK